MPYDEDLAMRVRAALGDAKGVTEKQMFGGIAFMVNGNMTAGVIKDLLMLRLGDAYEAALKEQHTEPMTFTGKPLKRMIYVAPPGYRTAASLNKWVKRALTYAESLPAKKKRPVAKKKKAKR